MPEPAVTASAGVAGVNPGRRIQQSAWTWASGLIATVVIAGAGFVATRYLLRWLGASAWGGWTVIAEWLGYLALGQQTLGPGAVTVLLLRSRAEGDDAFVAVAKRGMQLYLWAAAGFTPVALGLVWWGSGALHAGQLPLSVVRWALGLACASALLLAPPQLWRSVLETVQHGYQVRWALLVQALAMVALQLALSWRLRHGPWGLAGMAAANLAALSLGAGLWWWWARRWLPRWRRVRAAPITARQVWAINRPLMLAHLGNQINLLTDATVITLRLGSAAVTPFALTQTLIQAVGGQMTDIGAASWAPLGEMRARGDAAFGGRVVEIASGILGASLVFVAIAAAFTRALVTLWVGAPEFAGIGLTLASAGAAVTFSFICFFSWLIDTQGDTRHRLLVSSLGSLLNLGLSLYWLRHWGIMGVALATLVAYLATDAWFLPRLAVSRYGVPARALRRGVLRSLTWGGLWAAAVLGSGFCLPAPRTWVALAAAGLMAGGLGCSYCWWAILGATDRQAWRARWRAWRQ